MNVNKINKTMIDSFLKAGEAKLSEKLNAGDKVKNERDPKIVEAAQNFEGLFLQNLMNEMMKSTGEEFMGKGLSGDIFKGLFVEKMSEQLISGRGMGLSSLIYDYFEKTGIIEDSNSFSEKK